MHGVFLLRSLTMRGFNDASFLFGGDCIVKYAEVCTQYPQYSCSVLALCKQWCTQIWAGCKNAHTCVCKIAVYLHCASNRIEWAAKYLHISVLQICPQQIILSDSHGQTCVWFTTCILKIIVHGREGKARLSPCRYELKTFAFNDMDSCVAFPRELVPATCSYGLFEFDDRLHGHSFS